MGAIDETTKTNYAFRNQNGAGIWLPPNPLDGLNNLARIDPYTPDSVQKYPTGAIGFRDRRKFAYSYAGDTLRGIARLLIDASYIPGASGQADVDGFEGETYAAAAAGATYVDIEDTTVARAKNYYEDGLFTVFNADGVKTTSIRIAASDVGNGSTHVRLYLDDPLPWAIVEHDWCDAYRSPYADVTESVSDGFESFVGLALVAVTSGYYFWAQIAGPCWLAQSAAATIPGYTVDKRDAFAHRDGTCIVGSTAGSLQRVGYALGKSVATTGDTYIMMQLG